MIQQANYIPVHFFLAPASLSTRGHGTTKNSERKLIFRARQKFQFCIASCSETARILMRVFALWLHPVADQADAAVHGSAFSNP